MLFWTDDGMVSVWVSSRWPEDCVLERQQVRTSEARSEVVHAHFHTVVSGDVQDATSLESEEDGAAARMQRQVMSLVGGVTGDMLRAGSKAFRPAINSTM